MMVGRDVGALYGERPIPEHGAVALEVEGLTRRRSARDPHAIELVNVSLRAHHGEILGLAGLVGAGRTETARAIFGADKFDRGAIRVDGKQVRFAGPRDAMAHGIGLVPEDRKKQALFLRLAIRTNMTIAAQDQISRGWFVDERREDKLIDEFRRLLSIRMASADQQAGLLSGGNQQKVVLARWLALRPKILIVDEPTRGIDIGSKVEVHNLLDRHGEVRHRRHRDFVRTAGDPRGLRPHCHHARRARHRRDGPHRCDPGDFDGDDDGPRGRAQPPSAGSMRRP